MYSVLRYKVANWQDDESQQPENQDDSHRND